jgi:hypothetical protein
MTKRDLAVAVTAFALASGLVYAQGKTTVLTGNAQPVTKWDAFCADAVGSGVKTPTVDEAREPSGWNTVLKRYGEGGWEPFHVLVEGNKMTGVCFRRALQ